MRFQQSELDNQMDIFQSFCVFGTDILLCVPLNSISVMSCDGGTAAQRVNFVLKRLTLENIQLIRITQTVEASYQAELKFGICLFLHKIRTLAIFCALTLTSKLL